jgi:RpiB/LacA/LacB family sugar-phosphate isomerase
VARNKTSRGVIFCGSGVGVEVVANKFDGVRAALGMSAEQVRAGRNDDNMNILVLATDFIDEDQAKEMLKAFLETKFGRKARYKRRLQEIERIEANN